MMLTDNRKIYQRVLAGSRLLAIPLLMASSVAMAKGIYHKGWIDFNKNGKMDVFENPSAPLEARVKDLLSQMNLEEKTCQMVRDVCSRMLGPQSNGRQNCGRMALPILMSRPMDWERLALKSLTLIR